MEAKVTDVPMTKDDIVYYGAISYVDFKENLKKLLDKINQNFNARDVIERYVLVLKIFEYRLKLTNNDPIDTTLAENMLKKNEKYKILSHSELLNYIQGLNVDRDIYCFFYLARWMQSFFQNNFKAMLEPRKVIGESISWWNMSHPGDIGDPMTGVFQKMTYNQKGKYNYVTFLKLLKDGIAIVEQYLNVIVTSTPNKKTMRGKFLSPLVSGIFLYLKY